MTTAAPSERTTDYEAPDLTDRIALVAGATRGAGRGIATELGAAGATVYVTGRTTATSSSPMQRPETIEATADAVDRAGGTGIAVPVDHADPAQVEQLVDQIRRDHGRIDILVNDIWGGDPLTEWGVPFWEHDLANGLRLLHGAVDTHLITSWFAVPLMLGHPGGLVVEVTDGLTSRYRGSMFYDLAKASAIRLALAQAEELRAHGVAAVAVTPGFLRSEAMLEHFGVTADTWRDAIAQDPHFAHSETPRYVGRGVAALAADKDRMGDSGTATASWELMNRYGFTDSDGTSPDFGRYAREHLNLNI